ncbi:MAG: hypothetical protein BGO51_26025 [Rhodospirillales bacterium 69-11]|jgi:hypothetical protein|nr:MAG: hypothetical protein BGO51_26025 [Rhodospirillales bacterium 69-11]
MPPEHTLNVFRIEPLRDLPDDQVRSGRFQAGNEMVRPALHLPQDGFPRDETHAQELANGADGIGWATETCEPRPAGVQGIGP